MVYAAGNGIATWLGFDSWVDVVNMQTPKNVRKMRYLLRTRA
jgi:hypothetical protein